MSELVNYFKALVFIFILFIILIRFSVGLMPLTKMVGHTLLFLPEKIGRIQTASEEECRSILFESTSNSNIVNITKKGKYIIYCGHYLSPVNFKTPERIKLVKWLVLKEVKTDVLIPITDMNKGVRPFDTPFVQGRPVGSFSIENPGQYELNNNSGNFYSIISIVPDFISGHETEIIFFYFVQVLIIILILLLPLLPKFMKLKKKRQALIIMRDEKKRQFDAFWNQRIKTQRLNSK